MSFSDEFRMLSVSKAANDVAFGLIFLKHGERGGEIAAKLKGGMVLAEYLNHGKEALNKPAVCGDDLDPIQDYEILMSYGDGRSLFNQLQDGKVFLGETIKAILEGAEVTVDKEKIKGWQQLMNRIANIYVQEVSLSRDARYSY